MRLMDCANWEVMNCIGSARAGAEAAAGARKGLPCFGFLEGREVAEEDLGDALGDALGAAGLLGFFGSHASKEADGEGALADAVGFLSHSLREACEEADAEAEAEVAAADVEAALRSSVDPFRFVCFGMFVDLFMFTIRLDFKCICTI
jgi:hypothetical protein